MKVLLLDVTQRGLSVHNTLSYTAQLGTAQWQEERSLVRRKKLCLSAIPACLLPSTLSTLGLADFIFYISYWWTYNWINLLDSLQECPDHPPTFSLSQATRFPPLGLLYCYRIDLLNSIWHVSNGSGIWVLKCYMFRAMASTEGDHSN